MTAVQVEPLELPARLTAPPRLTQRQVAEELVRSNCALVVYEPDPDVDVIDVD